MARTAMAKPMRPVKGSSPLQNMQGKAQSVLRINCQSTAMDAAATRFLFPLRHGFPEPIPAFT
jgi:hypothetical protein